MLSNFGLVPAAAMGLDVQRLLETAQPMERACGPDVPPAENPGVQLGVALGVAAQRFGRDKVTIIASPGIADSRRLAGAASGGEHGQAGARASFRSPASRSARRRVYGDDRFFAYLAWTVKAIRRSARRWRRWNRPAIRSCGSASTNIWHIGQEFFRWEIATAVAGAIIGIDPFDQPDVEASKDKTRALTAAYEKIAQAAAKEEPVFRENGLALYADPRNAAELGRHNTLTGYLKGHFGRVHAGANRAITWRCWPISSATRRTRRR